MKPTIGKTEDGKDLVIDLQRLLETRLLVQSNSGGGKSWLQRRLLEQTAGHVQQVIIDTEGEFSTLREKFDYVICAPSGANAVATPDTAALLSRRLRETRVSAIVDIYDLKMHERRRFVRLFLEEFIDAPKSMWHPVLVDVDEAHLYCPEKGEAESASAMIDLASRGRKRGLCAVFATQRLSKLHKDAAAELLNKLVGRTGLDVDVKRAADELGLSYKDAMQTLRNLEPGEFFAFGPALSKTISKVIVGPVQTKHPKSGDRQLSAPPAPSEKIKKVLAELADLPKEAEQEARTLADLKRENATLKRTLTLAQKSMLRQMATEIKVIEKPMVGKHAADGITKACKELRKIATRTLETHKASCDAMGMVAKEADRLMDALAKVTNTTDGKRPTAILPRMTSSRPQSALGDRPNTQPQRKAEAGNGAGLPGPQQRILNAIAWFESIGITEPEQTAVAFLAGYTVGGGAWKNPRGALHTAGLIEYRGKRMAFTDEGRRHADAPTAPLTTNELHRHVLERLPGPERKLLTMLIQSYPTVLTDEELADATGYSPGGGAFKNPKGRLSSLGLITYPSPKASKAADLLFLAE